MIKLRNITISNQTACSTQQFSAITEARQRRRKVGNTWNLLFEKQVIIWE